MIITRSTLVLLATLLVGAVSVSAQCDGPYTLPKFQAALEDSKFQAPDSSTAASTADLINGYCSDWLNVQDSDKMAFYQTGASKRSELRQLTNWDPSTDSRTAHASIQVISQTCDQVTIMQIHDDANAGSGPNKPLLRIYRHMTKTPVNHIWAVIKTDTSGNNNVHVDLGETPGGYFDCDISINSGIMQISINGAVKDTRDISYWNFPSYWKAGAYLQDNGAATVYFNELTWPETTIAQPPVFTSDPIVALSATDGTAYFDSIDGSATDANGDLLTYTKVSGPAWLSIASDGTLSGTPGSSDVGNNLFTVQADDGNSGTATAQLEIAVLEFGAIINVANGELTLSGSVSGSYTDTANSDNVYEALTEGESGGKPSNRYSLLEHTWTINASGSSAYLYVEAYKTTSSDGDDFVFSYSKDGVNFTPAIIISNTADDNIANGVGIGAVNGTVTIKVEDTNHTSGNNSDFDTLYIDSLFIETGGTPPANTPPVFTSDPFSTSNATENAAYSDSLANSATDADSDPLTYSKVSGPAWLSIASNGALSGTPGSANLGLNTFTVEVNDGSDTATATLEITVNEAGAIPDSYVSDIAMSGGSSGGNRKSGIATITVLDDGGSPVANAVVNVNWSGATTSSDSGSTDGSGVVVFESGKVKGGGTFTVTVTNVTAGGYSYNSSLNIETSDSITNN